MIYVVKDFKTQKVLYVTLNSSNVLNKIHSEELSNTNISLEFWDNEMLHCVGNDKARSMLACDINELSDEISPCIKENTTNVIREYTDFEKLEIRKRIKGLVDKYKIVSMYSNEKNLFDALLNKFTIIVFLDNQEDIVLSCENLSNELFYLLSTESSKNFNSILDKEILCYHMSQEEYVINDTEFSTDENSLVKLEI